MQIRNGKLLIKRSMPNRFQLRQPTSKDLQIWLMREFDFLNLHLPFLDETPYGASKRELRVC
jgi:hypothetical protein